MGNDFRVTAAAVVWSVVSGLLGSSAFATPALPGTTHETAQAVSGTWLVWGGDIEIRFNPDALVALGLTIENVTGAQHRTPGVPGVRYESMTFRARDEATLEMRHAGNKISAVGGGELAAAGGFVLAHGDARSDLTGLRLRAAPGTLFDLELVDRAGTAWFTSDHAHYGFDDTARTRFGMRNMNLRVAPALAALIGAPEAEGRTIGGLAFSARAATDTAAQIEGGVCEAPWPTAGMTTDIQTVFRLGSQNWTSHDDSVVAQRCKLPAGGGCTGASTTGTVVISPDSSLVNIGDTAVAWHSMFSGESPPYNNDQHPFLIWNLYRLDGDGSIRQIGVSGVKHAFLTINFACSCGSGNVIYPTCEDTYSSFNNDQSDVLGPRREIVPYTAQWGRCGSMFDADCDGEQEAQAANGLYDQRMLVRESNLQSVAADAAKYYFEYWYIVRDDQNIYNTMGHRQLAAGKSASGSWTVSLVGAHDAPDHDFYQGPVINRWVDPVSPGANAANQELSTPLGRARIAVKATDLGGGQWRYRYAVMNFDYAHVDIDAAHATEPNLKVDANVGFDRFSVPLPGAATDVRFSDADDNTGNDWAMTTADGHITWTAPPGNSLAWGTLARFEFTTNVPPATAQVAVRGGATPAQAAIDYTQTLLAPESAPDIIFVDHFE